MNLEIFVDGLVVVAGFVGWIVFVPQIRLLLQMKKSDTISLGMVWGSFALQAAIFIQGILKKNWPLVFVMSTSLICLCIVLFLIYRGDGQVDGELHGGGGKANAKPPFRFLKRLFLFPSSSFQ